MIKRKIRETTIEYDKNGEVVSTTITETTEEDDNFYGSYCVQKTTGDGLYAES